MNLVNFGWLAGRAPRLGQALVNFGRACAAPAARHAADQRQQGMQRRAVQEEVWEKDEQVDDLTYIAMESVIDFLSKDKKNLDFSTHLIFATKNLERAGDHITNIAETVCYLVKGEYLKGSRPKGKVIQE